MQTKILEFIVDPDWKKMLEVDIMVNKNILYNLNKSISKIKNSDYGYIIIEEEILFFRKEIDKLLNALINEKNIEKKYKIEREAYAYYGFIECITEGSILTELLYEKLDLDFLNIIDKSNPSELTNFNKCDYVFQNNKYVDLYLLMKKWQDLQHSFHENKLITIHNTIKKEFIEYLKINKPYIDCKSLLSKYYLNYLDNKPFIKDTELVKSFNIIGDDLSCIIGGKNLGLVKIKHKKNKTRKFYSIPVGSILKGNYEKISKSLNYKSYSVRSSATVEDSKYCSFAGMFKTNLNVHPVDIVSSIKDVFESANNKRVIDYVKRFNTNKPYMSVVVQEFDEPEYSGVWIGSKIDEGHLEYVEGNGEKLVSGHINPIYENWNKKFKKGFKNIGTKCINFQKENLIIADIEFCIINNKLYFVQFRPVTKIFKAKNINNKDLIGGIGVSKGIYKGTFQYLEEYSQDLDKDILIAEYTDPDWVSNMIKAKGVVTLTGGFLSHAAIISRELDIPCITGIGKNNLDLILEKETILINGTTGEIKL